MNTPEIRVGPDYFAIDHPPSPTSILGQGVRVTFWYRIEAQEVEDRIFAESFLARYLERAQAWRDAWGLLSLDERVDPEGRCRG